MFLKQHNLIYSTTLITGLTFPLQVIFNDHRVFLVPFILTFFLFSKKNVNIILNMSLNLSNLLILSLLFYLIIQSLLQISIAPTNTLNYVPLLVFLYCTLQYFYFNIIANQLDIDYFLKAIITLGYISTLFFA